MGLIDQRRYYDSSPPFREGCTSWSAGIYRGECPYEVSTPRDDFARNHWLEGWDYCRIIHDSLPVIIGKPDDPIRYWDER